MKQIRRKRLFVAAICTVAALGLAGCDDDDDDEGPPANVAGTWACVFSSEDGRTLQESWNIGQSSQEIWGSYTFDQTAWSFTGTYVDGAFNAIDADGWTLQLEFKENSASGTISGDGEIWTASLSR